MPTRFIKKVVAFALGVSITLFTMEVILRLLPVEEGSYAADPNESWPIHTTIPHSTYTNSIAWNLRDVQRGTTNNLGYVAPFDYVRGAAGVVVIGDSFIEGRMNRYEDTVQGALKEYLELPQPVMGFGMSGASMPHYLGTAGVIRKYFSPEWAVVLITARDFAEGFSASPGYYRWAPERVPPVELIPVHPRNELTKVVRTLALVRYVRSNLRANLSDLIRFQPGGMIEASAQCEPATLAVRDEHLIRGFVQGLPSVLGISTTHVILIFDSDRTAMYAGQWPAEAECPTVNVLARKLLIQTALSANMHVIDSGPLFDSYFKRTRKRLDYSPLDAHWNGTAHHLVARAVANIINQQDKQPGTGAP